MFFVRQLLLLFLAFGSVAGCAESYSSHPGFDKFADLMVSKHGFDRDELSRLFDSAVRKKAILEAIARPAERVLTWGEYRKIFLTPQRTEGGVEFWRRNEKVLEKAAREYGVPPQIIVAIIGVETRYGGNMGSYRVIDALSTLAFDYPPRSEFFLRELENFLLLAKEQGLDAGSLKGSYAGAMGMGQFIPSSYRAYAVDFDGDSVADIWTSDSDAIGSVANYFKAHGWRKGAPVANPISARENLDASVAGLGLKPTLNVRALRAAGFDLPLDVPEAELFTAMELENGENTEYWMGWHNFYVITRYNHSHLYAMAVYQLSEEILHALAQ